jgi:hypothetical protein
MTSNEEILIGAKDLRSRIVREYSSAGTANHNGSRKVIRCTNRSISDFIEEIFADYVAGCFVKTTQDQILVNQSIQIGTKTRRPDLIWCSDVNEKRERSVKAVFEIKADMGFSREKSQTLPQALAIETRALRGKYFKVARKYKEPEYLIFPNNLKFFLILISQENSGNGWKRVPIGRHKYSNLYVFKLFRGRHPNLKGQGHREDEVLINEADFFALHKELNEIQNSVKLD